MPHLSAGNLHSSTSVKLALVLSGTQSRQIVLQSEQVSRRYNTYDSKRAVPFAL